MTALTIFRTAKTSPRGPILPMAEHDRIAWRITRERHPKYYRKER